MRLSITFGNSSMEAFSIAVFMMLWISHAETAVEKIQAIVSRTNGSIEVVSISASRNTEALGSLGLEMNAKRASDSDGVGGPRRGVASGKRRPQISGSRSRSAHKHVPSKAGLAFVQVSESKEVLVAGWTFVTSDRKRSLHEPSVGVY